MKAIILYYRFLDKYGKQYTVGGIQTYMANLAHLLNKIGIKPVIYQYALNNFSRTYKGISIYGFNLENLNQKNKKMALFNIAKSKLKKNYDLLIFAADHCSVKNSIKRAILIQHGYGYDLPNRFLTSHRFLRSGFLGFLKKAQLKYRAYKNFNNCHNRVCVDHNFINLYKSIVPDEIRGKFWVIPNFTKLISENEFELKDNENRIKNILFARRFHEYRGTRIMAKSIKIILDHTQDLEFTFAGEGPDEKWLKNYFKGEPKVNFLKFKHEDSLDVHKNYDVAVIPSIASEGTSLSVAESMGAGCITIASGAGGITNMIINNFNGFIIKPDEDQLAEKIITLKENKRIARKIRFNGYSTAKMAFSHNAWENHWESVINYLQNV
jgi:glycosyltransferase involved in cell wall biosynthesis